ncbi:uncharacterized protein AB675_2557 [Cyphellophora attinorum]|uniref:Uncharacterized protein n=1 Tax=Cyphellophora attinorum TaxID=1664694 RepID=A0A0N1P397_9EURO|nr:uncharacterized protein AB675_2557 [Phialophora attinorum]KPI45052.1 hypothetical protein AB675_2557 [Phialophora attinorum]
MTITPLYTSPLLHHALIELPASLQFLLLPSRQLSHHTPHAHAIIRQYALLLFCSVLVALALALSPPTTPIAQLLHGRLVCALGLYHVGPVLRSGARVLEGWKRRGTGGWGGKEVEAGIYVVLHLIIGGRMFADGLRSLRV